MSEYEAVRDAGVRRTVIRSLAVLMGMFAFAFALVPLYDVFCRVTGINGKVDTTAQAIIHEEVDQSRYITVQFITRGSAGLPWQMSVATRQMRVHPGQTAEVDFTFLIIALKKAGEEPFQVSHPQMRLPTYEKLAVSVSKSSSYRGGAFNHSAGVSVS
ncbi:hypothetical protein HAALTHF_35970n [Vreelandella aquamarina]|nr:hypothetical protein HAALTHF_35970n [Halomonas axialensis]